MSTKTGTPPHWRMALAEAMKVWLTVTTSSPGPTPTASSARCSAVVQFDTAQAWGAPTMGGELGLEGGDLRPLREPAGEDDGGGGLGLLRAEDGLGDRDHERASSTAAAVSARHQATRSRDALVEGHRRAEAEVGGRGGAGGEAAGHRVDGALGLVDGHEVGRGPWRGRAARARSRSEVSVPLPTL